MVDETAAMDVDETVQTIETAVTTVSFAIESASVMAETSLKDDTVVMGETIDYIKYISMPCVLRPNRSAGMVGAIITMNTTV